MNIFTDVMQCINNFSIFQLKQKKNLPSSINNAYHAKFSESMKFYMDPLLLSLAPEDKSSGVVYFLFEWKKLGKNVTPVERSIFAIGQAVSMTYMDM